MGPSSFTFSITTRSSPVEAMGRALEHAPDLYDVDAELAADWPVGALIRRLHPVRCGKAHHQIIDLEKAVAALRSNKTGFAAVTDEMFLRNPMTRGRLERQFPKLGDVPDELKKMPLRDVVAAMGWEVVDDPYDEPFGRLVRPLRRLRNTDAIPSSWLDAGNSLTDHPDYREEPHPTAYFELLG